MEPEGSLPCS